MNTAYLERRYQGSRNPPGWISNTLKRIIQSLNKMRLTSKAELQWQPFGITPINGLYWVTGGALASRLAHDENGSLAFTNTELCRKYVALVSINYHPECGIYDAFPVAPHETGDFDSSYGITHYAPFQKPKRPKDKYL